MYTLLMVILVFNCSILHGGPQIEGPNTRLFEYPSEIIQNEYNPIFSVDSPSYVTIRNTRYENVINDLYILNDNIRLSHVGYDSRKICLNVSINKNYEILLLPLFDLSYYGYTIAYRNNQIEIYPTAIRFYNHTLNEIKLIFIFDDDNLLVNSTLFDIDKNEAIEKYSYIYDSNNRLINIIAETKDNNRIVRKTLFYDGLFRNIPRPYFHDLVLPNMDEIIIFENSSIKYHLKIMRSYGDGHVYEPRTLDEKEKTWYYTVFEYNENGDEIIQGIYRNDGNISKYRTIYSEYDTRNNWLKKIYINETNNRTVGEVNRIIHYRR